MSATQQHEVAAILAARAAAQLARAQRAHRINTGGGRHRRPAPMWAAPLAGMSAMLTSGMLVGVALAAAVAR